MKPCRSSRLPRVLCAQLDLFTRNFKIGDDAEAALREIAKGRPSLTLVL